MREIAAGRAAHEALKKLAGKYFENAETLDAPEEMTAFVDRLDRVLKVMVDSLADAVKGRREFEAGFEVESTGSSCANRTRSKWSRGAGRSEPIF